VVIQNIFKTPFNMDHSNQLPSKQKKCMYS